MWHISKVPCSIVGIPKDEAQCGGFNATHAPIRNTFLALRCSFYPIGHAASAQLTDEQFTRFYARFTGKWKANNAKSIVFKGAPPPAVTSS